MTNSKKNDDLEELRIKKEERREPAQPEEGTIDPCEEKIHNLSQERDENKMLYLRALADFKNLETRVRKERIEMRDALLEQFVLELIPVLDHLDMAGIFSTDPGLQMVSKLFADTLKSMGLQEIKLLDTVYDPHTAEAIEVIEDKPDGKIIEVALKGYMMNNRTIRPGKVKVGRTNQS